MSQLLSCVSKLHSSSSQWLNWLQESKLLPFYLQQSQSMGQKFLSFSASPHFDLGVTIFYFYLMSVNKFIFLFKSFLNLCCLFGGSV
jgi:hypothetical protein